MVRRHLSAANALGAILWLAAAALANPVQAQETRKKGGRAPLAVTFVDVTPKQSGAIHDKLKTIISKSDDINFTDPESFLWSAKNFNITRESLASDSKRKKNRELLRRVMRSKNLEAIVVYKRTGDTLHLIVIGPNGKQLKHFRSPVKRSRITDKQAVKVLKRIFKVLVPKVRAFRKKHGSPEKRAAGEPSDPPAAEKSQQSNKSGKPGSGPDARGPLASNVTVSGGPIVGRRSLTMNTQEEPSVLGHVTPFFGAGVRFDSIFGVLPAKDGAIGATVTAQYGRFSTRFTSVEKTVKGTIFRARGSFRYIAGLSSDLALFGQLGAQGFDVGLESNEVYVGSSYFGLSGGAGAYYRFEDFAQLRLSVDAVPALSTKTNQRAFGSGAFSLGVNGDTRFTIYAFKPVLLSAYYVFDLYQPNHPNPPEYDAAASGTDVMHLGGLAVEYQF